MKVIQYLLGAVFTVLATGILLYVSLTTGLGPWVAPTVILCAAFFLRFFSQATTSFSSNILVIQAIGSTGGAIATALGFSLPTLAFLQPALHAHWMEQPWWFIGVIGFFVIAAGLWGILIAHIQTPPLLGDAGLNFPVSVAITETIISQTQKAASWLLAKGVAFALAVQALREGWFGLPSLRRPYYAFSSLLGSALPFELLPVAWAIGFLAGLSMVLPLLIGMVSKYLVIFPLMRHADYLPWQFFEPMLFNDMTFAFCSGIVLSEAIESFRKIPGALYRWVQRHAMKTSALRTSVQKLFHRDALIAAVASIMALRLIDFPWRGIVLLLPISYFLIQHLVTFACRTGLGTYGRYMTFAMIPLLFLTPLSDVHVTMLCVFIGIAGAVAVDTAFNYKVADLMQYSFSSIRTAKIFGVIVTGLCLGGLYWMLCSHFDLGMAPLVAHRGRARALLLHSFHVNWIVLICGALYGLLLKRWKVNPVLAFGGLIMPNQITIALFCGALLSYNSAHSEKQVPFWSGVFAGDALAVLGSLLWHL